MFSGKIKTQEDMKTLVNPAKREEHLLQIAKRQHEKFGTIERKKRYGIMQHIAPTIGEINEAILDYDEDFIGPIVCFNIMTTISNLTMLHPDIAYAPSEISYNEDMTLFSMTYADPESDDWVRVDINGESFEMTLWTSNANWPSEGYENVSIADVVGTVRYLIIKGNAPANLSHEPLRGVLADD